MMSKPSFGGRPEAFVFGSVSNGDAVGAAIAYDFELTLAPFTTSDIALDPFETFVYIESEPGDVGTAFAQAKLYQTDVGINDPGSTNFPLAIDSYTLQAGDPLIDAQPSFSSPFVNNTASPVTYYLRFEANVSVLEVPEPAVASSLILGSLFLLGAGKAHRGKRNLVGLGASSSVSCKTYELPRADLFESFDGSRMLASSPEVRSSPLGGRR